MFLYYTATNLLILINLSIYYDFYVGIFLVIKTILPSFLMLTISTFGIYLSLDIYYKSKLLYFKSFAYIPTLFIFAYSAAYYNYIDNFVEIYLFGK